MKRFYSILFVLLAFQVIAVSPSFAEVTTPSQHQAQCEETLGAQGAQASIEEGATEAPPKASFWSKVKSGVRRAALYVKHFFQSAESRDEALKKDLQEPERYDLARMKIRREGFDSYVEAQSDFALAPEHEVRIAMKHVQTLFKSYPSARGAFVDSYNKRQNLYVRWINDVIHTVEKMKLSKDQKLELWDFVKRKLWVKGSSLYRDLARISDWDSNTLIRAFQVLTEEDSNYLRDLEDELESEMLQYVDHAPYIRAQTQRELLFDYILKQKRFYAAQNKTEETQPEQTYAFATPAILHLTFESTPNPHQSFLEAFVKEFGADWRRAPTWLKDLKKPFQLSFQDLKWIMQNSPNPKQFVEPEFHNHLDLEPGFRAIAVQMWMETYPNYSELTDDVFEVFKESLPEAFRIHLAQVFLELSSFHPQSKQELTRNLVSFIETSRLPEDQALLMYVQSDLIAAIQFVLNRPEPQNVQDFLDGLYQLNGINPNYILTTEIQLMRKYDLQDVKILNSLLRVKAQIEFRTGKTRYYKNPLELISLASGLNQEALEKMDLSPPEVREKFLGALLRKIEGSGFQSLKGWTDEDLNNLLFKVRSLGEGEEIF